MKSIGHGRFILFLKSTPLAMELTRIRINLKMLTWTYIIQNLRGKIYTESVGDACPAHWETTEISRLSNNWNVNNGIAPEILDMLWNRIPYLNGMIYP